MPIISLISLLIVNNITIVDIGTLSVLCSLLLYPGSAHRDGVPGIAAVLSERAASVRLRINVEGTHAAAVIPCRSSRWSP